MLIFGLQGGLDIVGEDDIRLKLAPIHHPRTIRVVKSISGLSPTKAVGHPP